MVLYIAGFVYIALCSSVAYLQPPSLHAGISSVGAAGLGVFDFFPGGLEPLRSLDLSWERSSRSIFVRGPTVIRWGLRICFFPRRLCIVSISAAHWYIHALTLTASSLQDWMAGKYFLIASWQSYRDWYILSRSPELVTFLPFESFGFVILSIAISVKFWFSSTDSLESPDSI